MIEQFAISHEMMWGITACVVMMLLDIVTGFVAAWMANTIQSVKMREGLFHKSSLIFIIITAYLCELFVLHVPNLGYNVPLVIPACVIIFLMEVVSILENIVKINPELKDSKLIHLFDEGVNNG